MGWAVVVDSDGIRHVLPTDADGKLLPWHEPTRDCGCRPVIITVEPDDDLVSHREPE